MTPQEEHARKITKSLENHTLDEFERSLAAALSDVEKRNDALMEAINDTRISAHNKYDALEQRVAEVEKYIKSHEQRHEHVNKLMEISRNMADEVDKHPPASEPDKNRCQSCVWRDTDESGHLMCLHANGEPFPDGCYLKPAHDDARRLLPDDTNCNNPVYLELRQIYCTKGAEFCRPMLEKAWKEIARLDDLAPERPDIITHGCGSIMVLRGHRYECPVCDEELPAEAQAAVIKIDEILQWIQENTGETEEYETSHSTITVDTIDPSDLIEWLESKQAAPVAEDVPPLDWDSEQSICPYCHQKTGTTSDNHYRCGACGRSVYDPPHKPEQPAGQPSENGAATDDDGGDE